MNSTLEVETLFIFCEGPHDVAFLRQVFKHHFALTQRESTTAGLSLADYPSPLNSLLPNLLKNHPIDSLPLGQGKAFLFPNKALFNDTQTRACILISTGGSQFYAKIKQFLSEFLLLFETGETFNKNARSKIVNPKYLFIQDADEVGKDHRIEVAIKELTRFTTTSQRAFLNSQKRVDLHAGSILADDKAIYIWGESPNRGTLEDLLMPLFKEALEAKTPSFEATAQALDQLHTWDTQKVAQNSKRSKALITLAGQKKKPGGAMHDIIDQAGLISNAIYQHNPAILELAAFIEAFTKWHRTHPS